ncbi:MAG: YfhO family protein [Flavobacteriaceae bacterium]|nr:YfhO family protein [Flavobacteriaceae bacterium]
MKNKIVQILIALLVFVIASLAYFSPVLKGERLFQSDIAQFRGVSKEIVDYRKQYGEEPYWTNRAFGGMPAYVVSAYYPHNYIKKADQLLRFLPRPADYVFLYFLSFFILLYVLKVEWRLSILGALAFGFSTYLIIIFGAGHNAKAHAIAYMPMVLAGIIAVFKKNYLTGFIITALGMAFEVNANHPQMTYYLLFMVLILGIVYLIDSVKEKEIPHYIKSVGILLVAVVLAVGVNSTGLLATKEYATFSTRSKSELTINPDGSKKEQITGGLDKDYITQYSYGIPETMNLLIPRFYGGGSRENLGTDSETYHFLKDKIGRQQAKGFSEAIPTYWGNQPIVEAPAYVGAVLIFLFVLGLFIVEGKLKKWLLVAVVFSILMSWGKNFSVLTDFFINYVPMYNKFRAVSSIQVIAEVAIPLLAIFALHKLLAQKNNKEELIKGLKYTVLVVGGIVLLFALAGTSLFNFESFRDAGLEQQLPGLSDAIIADRKSIFFKDSLRSLILILASGGLIWAFIKEKINKNVIVFGFAALILFDLVGVDKRYVNADDFVSKKQEEKPFNISQTDEEILKDKSYYRVANFMVDPMNDGSTSYLYNSIGGYHAAKPRRYQELFDYQIAKNNFEILNMLNVKYIKFPDNQGNEQVQLNSDANGNAWFVEHLKEVNSADEEIMALDSIDTKKEAIINAEGVKDLKLQYQIDSLATINLTSYKANELKYESNSSSEQFAVFSDIYYKNGWNASIDGVDVPHFNVNYVLRGMPVPAGKHEIIFKFEPTIIEKGNTITLISYALLLFIPLGWYFYEKRK